MFRNPQPGLTKLVVLLLGLFAFNLHASTTNALELVKTIPLPDVRGRIDHFALDAAGQRLFMAALGNDTVEVLDLATGKRIHSIRNCSEPQGLGYIPAENRLVIANGGSGTVNILDGTSFKVLHSIRQLPDADNVRYDPRANLVYVGYGNGALAVIDPEKGEIVAKIPLAGHPESFQLEQKGCRIFVNVPGARQIAVIDRDKNAVTATWPMKTYFSNFPMALDETDHRLFVGCRRPARLVIFDTVTGKTIGNVEIARDPDDVFYDAKRKLIYVSCGGGSIDVIDRQGGELYRLRERIPTTGGARTSDFAPERDQLFLAVRAGLLLGHAEVRIYQPRP